MRLRAYTQGAATELTPIRVTTQITHGKTKKLTVKYTLDGRKLKVQAQARH